MTSFFDFLKGIFGDVDYSGNSMEQHRRHKTEDQLQPITYYQDREKGSRVQEKSPLNTDPKTTYQGDISAVTSDDINKLYQGMILDMNKGDVVGPRPDQRTVKDLSSPIASKQDLKDFIGRYESGNNYNVIYGGENKDLTNMTLSDIYKLQQKMQKSLGSSAVGKYQIMHDTLKDMARVMGLKPTELFSEELQERLADQLLKRRQIDKYMSGDLSIDDFINNLSMEWAGLPNVNNKSHYEGDKMGNRSLVDVGTLRELLETLE